MMSELQLRDRSDFFAVPKKRYLEVEIEDFGIVRFQNLTARQFSQWANMEERLEATAWLICQTVVNAGGDREFRDSDIAEIGEMDSGLIYQLAEAAAMHCRNFGDLEKKVAKQIGLGPTTLPENAA